MMSEAKRKAMKMKVTLTVEPPDAQWGWSHLLEDLDMPVVLGAVNCEAAVELIELFQEDIYNLLNEADWKIEVVNDE